VEIVGGDDGVVRSTHHDSFDTYNVAGQVNVRYRASAISQDRRRIREPSTDQKRGRV
jgi:hypothetical protein